MPTNNLVIAESRDLTQKLWHILTPAEGLLGTEEAAIIAPSQDMQIKRNSTEWTISF
jgi:hypothetical protein